MESVGIFCYTIDIKGEKSKTIFTKPSDYINRRENESIIARNEKLKREKIKRYLPPLPGLCCVYSLKVIRLANEEIIVPHPPIFTPTRSSR